MLNYILNFNFDIYKWACKLFAVRTTGGIIQKILFPLHINILLTFNHRSYSHTKSKEIKTFSFQIHGVFSMSGNM